MMNQFIFFNVGLVEANRGYFIKLLPLRIAYFIFALVILNKLLKRVKTGSETVQNLRYVIILLVTKMQPFLLINAELYQQLFLIQHAIYSAFYAMLFYFWMSECNSLVFRVMSINKEQIQTEEVKAPNVGPKIIAGVSSRYFIFNFSQLLLATNLIGGTIIPAFVFRLSLALSLIYICNKLYTLSKNWGALMIRDQSLIAISFFSLIAIGLKLMIYPFELSQNLLLDCLFGLLILIYSQAMVNMYLPSDNSDTSSGAEADMISHERKLELSEIRHGHPMQDEDQYDDQNFDSDQGNQRQKAKNYEQQSLN